MWDFWSRLLDPSDFPPRWHCGLWSPELGWLHVASDLSIWAAYFVIPCALAYSAVRRKNLPFRGVVLLFVAFIVLCGLTHLMDAAVFWWPAYRLAGLIKLLTGLVSWVTVVALLRVMPRLMALRSPAELEQEIAARCRAEEALRALHASLEQRMIERTASLQESEERYRVLTDAIPNMIWAMRPDRTLEFLNGRMSEFTGLSAAQASAAGFAGVVHPDDLPRVLAAVADPLERGERHEIEYRLRHRAGGYRWVASCAVPLRDPAGAVLKWVGSTSDVHDRKGAERALRELNDTLEGRVAERTRDLRQSEERFRSAFEDAPIGMALVTPDGRWVRVNRALCAMLGYSADELLATDFQTVTHPDDLGAGLDLARRVLAGGIDSYQVEKRYFRKDGRPVHVLLGVSLVRDGDRAPVHFVAQIQDITERKTAEAALAASEALLRQFIAHAPVAIAMFDAQMRYVQTSERWVRDYGLGDRDIIGRSHYEVFPDLPDRWRAIHRRVLAGAVEGCAEEPFPRADGTPEWLQWEARPWHEPGGQIGGLIFFTQVVTERKRAAERLRESEERLKLALGNSRQALWDWDVRTGDVFLDDNWFRLHGYEPGEVPARIETWEQGLHPEDRAAVERTLADSLRADDVPFDVVYRARTKGGGWVWMNSRGRVQSRAPGGAPLRMTGTVQDVTERRRAELRVEVGTTVARVLQEAAGLTAVASAILASVCRATGSGVGEFWHPGRGGEALRRAAEWHDPEFDGFAQASGERTFAPGVGLPGRVWAGGQPAHVADLSADGTCCAPGLRSGAAYPVRLGDRVIGVFSFLAAAPIAADSADSRLFSEVAERIGQWVERYQVEETFRVLFEQSSDAHLIFDENDGIVDCNPAAVRMLRCAGKGELMALHPAALSPELQPDGRRSMEKCVEMDATARRLGHHRFDWWHRRADGDVFPCEVTLTPVELRGRVLLLIVWHDLTERQQAEAALRASEARYRSVVESLAEGVVVQDAAGTIIASNERASTILGLTREQMAGHTAPDPLWRTVRADGTPFPGDEHPAMVALRTGRPVFNVVLGVCKPGGALTWTTVNAVPIGQPAGDGSAAVVASFHDVTEARRLDERIKASLREKEVLLKEIHHRVKNNLQIVSTLLDLQSDHTSDPRTLEMFRESRGRVKSMALIHERLYHSHDVAHVNFTEYVRQLADDLFYTYRVGDDIRLELAVDIPPLTIDIAIPCGLLLNELMSNCFKHAFRDAPEGCIRVSLSRAPDGWNVLTVADDGPGFPAGTDFRNTTSFGLQLVNTLAEQLEGTIELTCDRGTTFTVRFPNQEP